jgi:hypothetical protein
MEGLAISRDHPASSVPQQPSQPQHPHPQPQQASREQSRTTSDHHHEGQAGSSQSQTAALKASHEEGWYLKSIDFASPSGVTRRYNIITQNYNGCAFPPYL